MGRNSARPPLSDLAVLAGDCRSVSARQGEYAPAVCQTPVIPSKRFRVRSMSTALRCTSRLHPREARGRVVRISLTTAAIGGFVNANRSWRPEDRRSLRGPLDTFAERSVRKQEKARLSLTRRVGEVPGMTGLSNLISSLWGGPGEHVASDCQFARQECDCVAATAVQRDAAAERVDASGHETVRRHVHVVESRVIRLELLRPKSEPPGSVAPYRLAIESASFALLKSFAVDAFAMAMARLPGHASPFFTAVQSGRRGRRSRPT
jgi:hypothetical protein